MVTSFPTLVAGAVCDASRRRVAGPPSLSPSISALSAAGLSHATVVPPFTTTLEVSGIG